MKKFHDILKEKAEKHNELHESKVLGDFKSVYGAMLEHYGLKSINDLNDESQLSFLTELNSYWSEKEGMSEKGQRFLMKRSISLNENSTAVQKKNFLKTKSVAIINETLRQSNLKYKLYDIVDEIYTETKSKDLKDVMSPDMLSTIIAESFANSVDDFVSNIHKELSESVTPKRKYFVKVKTNK